MVVTTHIVAELYMVVETPSSNKRYGNIFSIMTTSKLNIVISMGNARVRICRKEKSQQNENIFLLK